MEPKELKELIDRRNDVKYQLRQIEHELCDYVVRYKGTVKEALQIGLVKLNFAAPAGFKRFLKEG